LFGAPPPLWQRPAEEAEEEVLGWGTATLSGPPLGRCPRLDVAKSSSIGCGTGVSGVYRCGEGGAPPSHHHFYPERKGNGVGQCHYHRHA
jgi:hypothetical protein